MIGDDDAIRCSFKMYNRIYREMEISADATMMMKKIQLRV